MGWRWGVEDDFGFRFGFGFSAGCVWDKIR